MTTVLIVDDSDGFRRSARLLLEDDGFEIVGEARDGDGDSSRSSGCDPRVVVLDVQLARDDGFDVAEALAARSEPAGGRHGLHPLGSTPTAHLATTPARGFIAKADLSGETLTAMMG